ncbi:hypothetical protein [Streptosporangium carneum]|uniref:Uncharacterized protein n=1 Tax=Streptosporangium carneum TaxID=47481 RepID=A0A9W6I775_9ACTN|nr:hypothetical protein [Streptosporangium carneum]GLK12464.1 hypothetical protein GCM10017600_58740 [Streptosporangium carneum]
MKLGTTRLTVFDLVIAAGGLLLVLLAVQNLGPALAALRGEGTWGTFTARRVECVEHPGHEQCTWLGEFRGGRTVRPEVGFYGGDRETFVPGQAVRAFDTGRRGHVYGSGGSNEWIMVALLFAAGLGLVAWPPARLRRRAPEPAESPASEEAAESPASPESPASEEAAESSTPR